MHAYDPVAIPEAKLQLNGAVEYYDSLYAAAEKADAPMVCTAWPEFSFARSRSH
jgi:UDP-glucose 6-dehydrogenase